MSGDGRNGRRSSTIPISPGASSSILVAEHMLVCEDSALVVGGQEPALTGAERDAARTLVPARRSGDGEAIGGLRRGSLDGEGRREAPAELTALDRAWIGAQRRADQGQLGRLDPLADVVPSHAAARVRRRGRSHAARDGEQGGEREADDHGGETRGGPGQFHPATMDS